MITFNNPLQTSTGSLSLQPPTTGIVLVLVTPQFDSLKGLPVVMRAVGAVFNSIPHLKIHMVCLLKFCFPMSVQKFLVKTAPASASKRISKFLTLTQRLNRLGTAFAFCSYATRLKSVLVSLRKRRGFRVFSSGFF